MLHCCVPIFCCCGSAANQLANQEASKRVLGKLANVHASSMYASNSLETTFFVLVSSYSCPLFISFLCLTNRKLNCIFIAWSFLLFRRYFCCCCISNTGSASFVLSLWHHFHLICVLLPMHAVLFCIVVKSSMRYDDDDGWLIIIISKRKPWLTQVFVSISAPPFTSTSASSACTQSHPPQHHHGTIMYLLIIIIHPLKGTSREVGQRATVLTFSWVCVQWVHEWALMHFLRCNHS